MIGYFFNKKKSEYDDLPSDFTDFEKRLYKEKEHYRMRSFEHLERNLELSREIKEQETKFKSYTEKLLQEKFELETENEFLKKRERNT